LPGIFILIVSFDLFLFSEQEFLAGVIALIMLRKLHFRSLDSPRKIPELV
jgi:hypothetical protein